MLMRLPAASLLLLLPCLALAEKAGNDSAQETETFVPQVARQEAAEGNAAFEKGDYNAARNAYRRVLDLAPDNLLGLVNLGTVEFRSGNLEEAEKLLSRAVRIRMETAPAWLTLGILYYQQNRLDEALAALTQATLYDKGNPRSRNFLGAVFGAKGWQDAAEYELRRAVEIDPSYADGHYNLALLYIEQKPPAIELARRHYQRARSLGAEADTRLEKMFRAPAQPN